jgi:hypothetical protein
MICPAAFYQLLLLCGSALGIVHFSEGLFLPNFLWTELQQPNEKIACFFNLRQRSVTK